MIAQRIAFTAKVEEAIEESTLSCLLDNVTQARTSLILKLRNQMRTDVERKQLNILQTLLKEQVDVVSDLADSEVPAVLWQDECRLYLNADTTVTACCGEHEMPVLYNFPASQQLVTTKLTRECRLAYFKAMTSGRFLVPSGPAGTGKTETAKDIARLLGREAPVLNCSESTTEEAIEEALHQAGQCGPYTPVIFDEFNRVCPEVMAKVPWLVDSAGGWACFTFNPGHKLGTTICGDIEARSESVSMTYPDYATIASVMLGAQGFLAADELGAKLCSFLTAARETCSKQLHYDFGMRRLKWLVTEAGAHAQAVSFSEAEAEILAEVCFQSQTAMSVAADKVLVPGLIAEVFGISPPAHIPCAEAQLHRVLRVRHGGAIIAPREDAEALVRATASQHGIKTTEVALAGLPAEELYSENGVFASALRDAALHQQGEVWMVVQAGGLGAEANAKLDPLRSVLDDNKVLVTAESGTRVELPPHTRILLLLDSAQYLSPAVVSRLGFLHVGEPQVQQQGPPTVVKVKLELNGDKRRSCVESLSALRATAMKLYELQSVSLRYEDDEGDYVTLQEEADLVEAMQLIQEKALPEVLKVSVTQGPTTVVLVN